jgi:hypothetical protein
LFGSVIKSAQQPVTGLPSGTRSTLLGVENRQHPQQPQLLLTWIWTVCGWYPGAATDNE